MFFVVLIVEVNILNLSFIITLSHKFYNGEMNEYNKRIKNNIPNPVSVIPRYPQNIEKDIIEAATLAELLLVTPIRIFFMLSKKQCKKKIQRSNNFISC